MLLHTTDSRAWRQEINVGGKLYQIDAAGYVTVESADHALVLLQASGAWSKVAREEPKVEAAPVPPSPPAPSLPAPTSSRSTRSAPVAPVAPKVEEPTENETEE